MLGITADFFFRRASRLRLGFNKALLLLSYIQLIYFRRFTSSTVLTPLSRLRLTI